MNQLTFADPSRDPVAHLLADYERAMVECAVGAMGESDEEERIAIARTATSARQRHERGEF